MPDPYPENAVHAPILAVTDPQSPAQNYILELLYAAGLPCAVSCGSGELPGHELSPDTVLLLCDPALGTSASEAVADFIRAGGRTVALQPPPSLVGAFGAKLSPSGSGNGFVRVNPGPAGFGGLPDDPVQYFGMVSYLSAPHEQTGADLLKDDRYSYGARAVAVGNGGRTVAFGYDLIGTVLTLRFGLAWGTGSASVARIKPPVFYRHLVDPQRRHVPQADVHLALLARTLDLVSERTLPRVWPLPHGEPTALVLTCDGDENDPALFVPILETVRAHGANITFYLMPHTKIDPGLAKEIRAEGHSIAPHPHVVVDGGDPSREYARAYARQLEEFLGGTAFPGAATLGVGPERTRPLSVRAHGLKSVSEPGATGWTGYNAQAAIYADAGFRMDYNCYSVPPYQAGYMNGSALPMRFLDANGRFLPCYQQATQFADDILVGDGAHSVQVDGKTAGEWLVRALRASADRYHGAIVVNVHPHRFARSRPMLERALQFCAEKGIPVLNAESWCAFTLAARRVELDVLHPTSDGRTVRARAPGGRGDIAIALGDRYRPQGHTVLSEHPTHKQLIDEFGHIVAWEKEDVVEPGKPNAAGWLLPSHRNVHRRYPQVAILIPDTMGRTCGGLCTSCQRMHDFQSGHLNFDLDKLRPQEIWTEKLSRLMEYFENDSQLRDILITGGDALMSADKSPEKILDAVYEMSLRKKKANEKRKDGEKYAEICRVRLGTRLPVYLPQRITPDLISVLHAFKERALKIGIKQFVIQTHFVSPMEVTPEARDAIARLIAAGLTVTNQHVFTAAASRRGHNAKLRQVLNEVGVLPCYTFTVKGYMENYYNFAPNARAVQEQIEEKVIGSIPEKHYGEIKDFPIEAESMVENVSALQESEHLPFLATDRSVLNLPGVGKSLTFRVIGITRYGRRILEFDHDGTRTHSPIIDKMRKVVIIESKSISEYLEQLEDMGEDLSEYEGVFGYSIGERENRIPVYEYPPYDHKVTDEITNLDIG